MKINILALASLVAFALNEPALAQDIDAVKYRVTRVVAETRAPEGPRFHTPNGIALGPDKRLYVAGALSDEIVAFDRSAGKAELIVAPPDGHADDLIFNANGELIWTAVLDGAVRQKTNAGMIRDLARDLPGINSIAISEDGEHLYAAQVFPGADHDALWEIDQEGVKPPRQIVKGLGGLNAFSVASDGMIYGPLWFRGAVARVDPSTGAVTIIAEGFKKPSAVRIDASGQLYVLDAATGLITKIDRITHERSSFVQLPSMSDNMVIDSQQLMYVTNPVDNAIYEIDLKSRNVLTIVEGVLAFPRDIAIMNSVEGDRLYVADSMSLQRYDPDTGRISKIARYIDSPLQPPNGISIRGRNLILTSGLLGVVQIFDEDTGALNRELTGFKRPEHAVELADGTIVISEPAEGRLVVESAAGRRVLDGYKAPVGLADAGGGTIYVADSGANAILRVSVTDGSSSVVAADLGLVRSIAIAPDNKLLALDTWGRRLISIDLPTKKKTIIASNLPVGHLTHGYPRSGGIAVEGKGAIYVAGDVDNAIYRLEACSSNEKCQK